MEIVPLLVFEVLFFVSEISMVARLLTYTFDM